MARFIVHLFSMSIHSATFPVLWKRAIITPVQKCSKRSALTNFCPISVLPVMSKLQFFEKIFHNQLLGHINTFDLLSISQSGFCPEYSIDDVLIHVTESWRKAIDDGVNMLESVSGSCKSI